MRKTDFIIFLIAIAGCAYYSKTDITIMAEKVRYPFGISAIQLGNGSINIHRQMNAEGFNNGNPR